MKRLGLTSGSCRDGATQFSLSQTQSDFRFMYRQSHKVLPLSSHLKTKETKMKILRVTSGSSRDRAIRFSHSLPTAKQIPPTPTHGAMQYLNAKNCFETLLTSFKLICSLSKQSQSKLMPYFMRKIQLMVTYQSVTYDQYSEVYSMQCISKGMQINIQYFEVCRPI